MVDKLPPLKTISATMIIMRVKSMPTNVQKTSVIILSDSILIHVHLWLENHQYSSLI